MFWRVYAKHTGKVFVGAYSLLDGLFAGGLILIVVTQLFAKRRLDSGIVASKH